MRNYNLISGIILTLISGGACGMAYRLGLGTGSNPGPGFLAFGIAFLLGLMSLTLCFRGAVQMVRGYREKEPFKGRRWQKSIMILAGLTAYGLFFNILGFPVSAFLIMMLMLLIARQGVRTSLIVSLVTVVSAYMLFSVLFGLPLPQGVLWRLFGE